MAKRMTLLGALFAALLLSAGCDKDSKDNADADPVDTASDPVDTASDPTGDTASDDPGDTETSDPVDTETSDPVDTASDPVDTETSDPVDTASDPVDTETSDPVDTETSDPVDTASDPGDTETDDPGDTASDDPSDTASDPGDTDTGTDSETPPLICASDADCTDPGLGLCLVATGECVACIDDADCPGLDVCNDNTCEASDWGCDDFWYGDNFCDCGCGALDIDCDGPYAADCFRTFMCTDQGMIVKPDENWLCYMETPECSDDADCAMHPNGAFCDTRIGGKCVACLDDTHCADGDRCAQNLCMATGWTCSASWYGDGQCDCGCGALDIDCAGPESRYCNYTSACTNQWLVVDPDENWRCIDPPPAPDEWNCPSFWYSDSACDCGCGALDIDCAGPESRYCNYTSACTNQGLAVHPDENWRCIDLSLAPAEWTCNPYDYDDYFCDCGCGVLDIDCAGPEATRCHVLSACTDQGLVVDPNENWRCIAPFAPAEWDCLSAAYGDGQCDCGCGALDIDCAGPRASYCDIDICPSDMRPHIDENWRCDAFSVPAEWVCADSFYGDDNGFCDCGCGVIDYDCDGPYAADCDWTFHCTDQWLVVDPNQNWRCIDP